MQLKQSLSLDFRVPTEAECVAEFERWIEQASKHGLVWLIDGLDRVVSPQFEWLISTLRASEHGVVLIITCSPGTAVSDVGDSPDIGNVQKIKLEQLSPASSWNLQASYFQSYSIDDADEASVTVICDAATSILQLRIYLATYRLLTPIVQHQFVKSNSAQESFLYLVEQLRLRSQHMYFAVLLLALSNCGVRESEFLCLLRCTTQEFWEMRDCLLDELAVLVGFLRF